MIFSHFLQLEKECLSYSSNFLFIKIYRDAQTERIYVLIKGADEVMLDKTNAMSANMIEEDADLLAREGLRTLVFLIKEMTKEEYQTWKQELVDIQCDVTKNEADEEVVITKLETDMIFLGVTGVEDLLQDGVRETIEDLFEGGIRVWVLTGDKKETAKCIAIKTGLTNDANN